MANVTFESNVANINPTTAPMAQINEFLMWQGIKIPSNASDRRKRILVARRKIRLRQAQMGEQPERGLMTAMSLKQFKGVIEKKNQAAMGCKEWIAFNCKLELCSLNPMSLCIATARHAAASSRTASARAATRKPTASPASWCP